MCAAPAAAAALAVLFPIIFNHPFPFFHLTIVFLVIDIVTSARIASVCIEDVVVRINTAPLTDRLTAWAVTESIVNI